MVFVCVIQENYEQIQTDLKQIYVPVEKGSPVPLSELATIRYEQGPQVIKSEDTFLVGYVLFDKLDGFAEVNVVENAQALIQAKNRFRRINCSKRNQLSIYRNL